MTILENLYSEYINGNEAYYEEQKNDEADKSMKQVDATIRQVAFTKTLPSGFKIVLTCIPKFALSKILTSFMVICSFRHL